MDEEKSTIQWPYIPNSEEKVKAQMLKYLGISSIEELYEDIPENLRLKRALNVPKPLLSEYALRRYIEQTLSKNKTCNEYLSFLGAGCYQHYVPAICDEVNSRGELLTAYAGEPYDDHGRFQTLFEYTSMMGELLEMDVVNVPTYDWSQAAATSIRMGCRITGRQEVLVARAILPDNLSRILDYCKPRINVKLIDYDPKTGLLNLNALETEISSTTAVVYFENPSYFGLIETQGVEISQIAHDHGVECVVGVDPTSLGILMPPSIYGADIVCGDVQPLGMHMQFGGGHGGFIATRDEVKYVMEYPSRLFGVAPTSVEGEWGFGDVAYDRTSFGIREEGKEWVGTATALWGITAGVYLALMGPQGMVELGESIMHRSHYAKQQLSKIEGITSIFPSAHFKEFLLRFETRKIVEEINIALLEYKIFGGKIITNEFPELGQCALYCITEIHTKKDIDHLAKTLEEVL